MFRDKHVLTTDLAKQFAKRLAGGHVIVIGPWEAVKEGRLTLQHFQFEGGSFIPIFSSEEDFRIQIKGSEFAASGLSVDCQLLLSVLHGDEILILDPGSASPVRLSKSDFE